MGVVLKDSKTAPPGRSRDDGEAASSIPLPLERVPANAKRERAGEAYFANNPSPGRSLRSRSTLSPKGEGKKASAQ